MRTRTVLAAIAAVAAIVFLLIGIFLLKWFSAPARGKLAAREQIQANGGYRIAAYDHFFDLCASVQTKEATIAILHDQLKTAAATQKDWIEASITANRAARADDINQYNADSRKSYTLGQFRSSGLPYTLDLNAKETTCAVG